MIYYVTGGTLNPAHSLTLTLFASILIALP